jgi:sugar phosphate isomerase/epimerase
MHNPFKLCLNIDNVTMKPPAELCPGWETAEIPITECLLPYDTDAVWQKKLEEIRTWNQPPFVATSHWLWEEKITGDQAADFNELERQAEQACRRMAQLSGGMVAGVWGNFFEVTDESLRSKSVDDALKYCEMIAKYAEKYGVFIALEPTANPKTVFPRYTDGLNFVKKLNHPRVRVMADLNYFTEIDEPFEDIVLEPDYCLHVHIQGDPYQPNYGSHDEKILRLFRILRDIGYERSVSSAHPWISTEGDVFDYRIESEKTLRYLKSLREQVYAE